MVGTDVYKRQLQRRKELGGFVLTREVPPPSFQPPALTEFTDSLAGSKGLSLIHIFALGHDEDVTAIDTGRGVHGIQPQPVSRV